MDHGCPRRVPVPVTWLEDPLHDRMRPSHPERLRASGGTSEDDIMRIT